MGQLGLQSIWPSFKNLQGLISSFNPCIEPSRTESNVNDTELRGLWEGLCWVTLQLGAQRIWVEGDFLNTIKALSKFVGPTDGIVRLSWLRPSLHTCILLRLCKETVLILILRHGPDVHRQGLSTTTTLRTHREGEKTPAQMMW